MPLRDDKRLIPRQFACAFAPDPIAFLLPIGHQRATCSVSRTHRCGKTYWVGRSRERHDELARTVPTVPAPIPIPRAFICAMIRYPPYDQDRDPHPARQTLKHAPSAPSSTLGVSTTEAITMFLRQVVLNQGLPFPVRIPNAETVAAIKAARENPATLTAYDSRRRHDGRRLAGRDAEAQVIQWRDAIRRPP